MNMVSTTRGLIESERLAKHYSMQETDDEITIAREWLFEGAMVRRDVWVTLKRGLSMTAEKGKGA